MEELGRRISQACCLSHNFQLCIGLWYILRVIGCAWCDVRSCTGGMICASFCNWKVGDEKSLFRPWTVYHRIAFAFKVGTKHAQAALNDEAVAGSTCEKIDPHQANERARF